MLVRVSVATGGAWWDLVMVKLEGFGKLEAIDGSTLLVPNQQSANVSWMEL